MTDKEILQEELEAIKKDLIEKHDELNMRASGKWANSLQVTTTDKSGVLTGFDYTYYLQYGRKGGTMPPIQAIEEWIKNKGLKAISDKIKTSSLAWAIAMKIKKDGTRYFQQGGTDLIDSVITPERIQKIIDRLSVFHVKEFTSKIIDFIKKQAV